MIGPTIRIARLFGIPIRVDISWFVIFVIFVYAFTQNFFKPLFPDVDPLIAGLWAVGTVLLFFCSVLLHELAHSLVAIANGLKVKSIALFILGGVSQLEGEPPNPWVEFWMALAGPLASLLIGLVCGALSLATGGAGLVRAYLRLDFLPANVSIWAAVLFWLALENIALFLFNSIPAFPIDGGRVVRAFIWGVSRNYSLATRIAAWLSRGMGALFLIFGAFSLFAGNWTGIWFLLLGFFLLTAARAGLNQATIREMLQGYTVGQFVRADTPVVPGQLSLDLLIQEYYGRHQASLYPVRVGDALAGVVTRALVEQALKNNASQRVSDVMAPLGPEYVIGPQAPAQEAFDRMSTNSAGSLLVMEGDRLLGVVTQNEMLRLARLFPILRRASQSTPPGSPVSLTPPPVSPPSAPPEPPDHYERFGP